MRLSEWRAAAPARDAVTAKVGAVVDPVLAALGAGSDPHAWVAWGDEPANRYSIFVPTDPGLIVSFVRVNVPGEGPRATTKLVRWNKVSIGELSIETQGGHRLLSFQLETQVIRGADAEADRAAAFAVRLIAAIDGRPLPPAETGPARPVRAGGRASGAVTGRTGASAGATTNAPKRGSGAKEGTAKSTALVATSRPRRTPGANADR